MNIDPDLDWNYLEHAYGPAGDIPDLLAKAQTDTRPGHEHGSTWFELWSALCHQGDCYTASYAALPHLVSLAAMPIYRARYDPLFLAASSEVSRLVSNSPPLPTNLAAPYGWAIKKGGCLATEALTRPLDEDSRIAFEGCVAAFHGQPQSARNIWDADEWLEK
jgi:hypothetical protein